MKICFKFFASSGPWHMLVPLPRLPFPTLCPTIHPSDFSWNITPQRDFFSGSHCTSKTRYDLLFSHGISSLSLVGLTTIFNYLIISINLLSYLFPSQNCRLYEAKDSGCLFPQPLALCLEQNKGTIITWLTWWSEWMNEQTNEWMNLHSANNY